MSKNPFKEIDPYNPQNTIEGDLLDDTDVYGDLIIEFVNGKPCHQHIHATPKFFYPGGAYDPRERAKLSSGFAKVFEKIDGTNILRFNYHDEKGQIYISYKTRLSPFVRKTVFQDFKKQWDNILKQYPKINTFPPDPYMAFELYGSVNPIIVRYKIPLDIKFIYTLNQGEILPPDESSGLPLPKLFFEGEVSEELYQEFEDKVEAQYIAEKSIEGVMFYMKDVITNKWNAYKCKSRTLLNDSNDHKMSKSEVLTTATNAMEIIQDLSELFDATIKLLLETFSNDYVDFHKQFIMDTVTNLVDQVKREQEIIAKYKDLKLDIQKDKKSTMNIMMQYYPKKDSAFIYSTLIKYFMQ